MVIRINTTFLPSPKRSKLINFLMTKFKLEETYSDNDHIISLDTTSNIQTIKKIVENIFVENYDGYIITENNQVENEIAILKKGDLEQLEYIYVFIVACRLKVKDQRSIHQRIHYF